MRLVPAGGTTATRLIFDAGTLTIAGIGHRTGTIWSLGE